MAMHGSAPVTSIPTRPSTLGCAPTVAIIFVSFNISSSVSVCGTCDPGAEIGTCQPGPQSSPQITPEVRLRAACGGGQVGEAETGRRTLSATCCFVGLKKAWKTWPTDPEPSSFPISKSDAWKNHPPCAHHHSRCQAWADLPCRRS